MKEDLYTLQRPNTRHAIASRKGVRPKKAFIDDRVITDYIISLHGGII